MSDDRHRSDSRGPRRRQAWSEGPPALPELLPQLRLDELLAEPQARLQAVLVTRDGMRALLEAVVAISTRLPGAASAGFQPALRSPRRCSRGRRRPSRLP